MPRWLSRLFGQNNPPAPDHQIPANVVAHADELVKLANESLQAACASRDPAEREDHQSIASMAVLRLELLAAHYPAITLTSLPEFENDLRMVADATKALRMEIERKRRNIPKRY